MLLEDKIYQDYVAALKARDKVKTDFLSLIRAELRNASIDLKKKPLPDTDAVMVLKKQKKRLEESKESIVQSGRADLLEKIDIEIITIDAYLPPPLSESEVIAAIDRALVQTQACSVKDMGKVMKEVLSEIGSQADSRLISDIVRKRLSS